MDAKIIESFILEAIPDASLVRVEDIRGDGGLYNVTVSSPSFAGKTRIEQHRMIYATLKGKIGEKIHALSIQTFVDGA